MRLVNGVELMKLPSGTLYSEIRIDGLALCDPEEISVYKWETGLSIKGENWFDFNAQESEPFDWGVSALGYPDSDSSEDLTEKMDQMLKENISVPLDKSYKRDGQFRHEDRYFVIWERDDLKYLKEVIEIALKVAI